MNDEDDDVRSSWCALHTPCFASVAFDACLLSEGVWVLIFILTPVIISESDFQNIGEINCWEFSGKTENYISEHEHKIRVSTALEGINLLLICTSLILRGKSAVDAKIFPVVHSHSESIGEGELAQEYGAQHHYWCNMVSMIRHQFPSVILT